MCSDRSSTDVRVRKMFLEKLIPFRKQKPRAWHTFACAVYKEASNPLCFAEAPIPPPIVPNLALMPVDAVSISTKIGVPTIKRQNIANN